MTTEELEVAEQTSDQDELAPLEVGDDGQIDADSDDGTSSQDEDVD